jgi:hypothetical protein
MDINKECQRLSDKGIDNCSFEEIADLCGESIMKCDSSTEKALTAILFLVAKLKQELIIIKQDKD